MMATRDDVPKYDALMIPVLQALKQAGGSASIDELVELVAQRLGISDDVRAVLNNAGTTPEFAYRLAWARTYLKKFGAITNSERGVWSLTGHGETLTDADVVTIKRAVQSIPSPKKAGTAVPRANDPAIDGGDVDAALWDQRLLEVLQAMSPDGFERLCQRILRESGFTRVDVTGRSGDGGIDGIGVLRMNLVSFHVLFQCKRWKGTVGSSVIRDFRGAMVGRADKGLVITTGTFTAEARREASRDGAPAIDLIDGETLCGLLKNLKLGVSVRFVEEVAIEADFFRAI